MVRNRDCLFVPASSPFPVRLTDIEEGTGVPADGVAGAVDCKLSVTFRLTCADLSCFIAFELFCNTCKAVRELWPPLPPPEPNGPQAAMNSATATSASAMYHLLYLVIGILLIFNRAKMDKERMDK